MKKGFDQQTEAVKGHFACMGKVKKQGWGAFRRGTGAFLFGGETGEARRWENAQRGSGFRKMDRNGKIKSDESAAKLSAVSWMDRRTEKEGENTRRKGKGQTA